MGILRQFDRFGHNLKRNFTQFGVQAGKDLRSAGRFIAKKSLPVIQEVVGGIGKAASLAAPLLLATGFGAPAAAIAAGIGAGGKALEFGIKSGRRIADVAESAKKKAREKAKEKRMITVAGQLPPMAESEPAPSMEKSVPVAMPVGETRGVFGT